MDSYRERLIRKYRKYRAILILVNSLDKTDRMAVDRTLESMERGRARKLREKGREFDDALNEIVTHYGVVASLRDLERMLETVREGVHVGKDEYLLISKYHFI